VGTDVTATPVVVVVVVVVISSSAFEGAGVIGAIDVDDVIGAFDGFLLGDLDVGKFV
jgi:hypothetical protein